MKWKWTSKQLLFEELHISSSQVEFPQFTSTFLFNSWQLLDCHILVPLKALTGIRPSLWHKTIEDVSTTIYLQSCELSLDSINTTHLGSDLLLTQYTTIELHLPSSTPFHFQYPVTTKTWETKPHQKLHQGEDTKGRNYSKCYWK